MTEQEFWLERRGGAVFLNPMASGRFDMRNDQVSIDVCLGYRGGDLIVWSTGAVVLGVLSVAALAWPNLKLATPGIGFFVAFVATCVIDLFRFRQNERFFRDLFASSFTDDDCYGTSIAMEGTIGCCRLPMIPPSND